jgi:hypothetical protein
MCSNTTFSAGKVAPQRLHHALDEHRLAVEDVDLGVGHLAMHQQQQALALHRVQRAVGLADVGDAGVAVGGGAGRVQLERHHAGGLGAQDLGSRGLVGQVQRHQRRERQLRAAARPGCARGSPAPPAVVTGGFRLGITMARPNWRAVKGSTACSAAPSRRCRCQSSGRVIVRVVPSCTPAALQISRDALGPRQALARPQPVRMRPVGSHSRGLSSPQACGLAFGSHSRPRRWPLGAQVLQDLGQEVLGSRRARIRVAKEVGLLGNPRRSCRGP